MEVVRNLKTKKKKVGLFLLILSLIISAAIFYFNTHYYEGKKIIETLNPSWGMGIKVTEAVSNNRNYDWYVNQYATGKYSYQNCGPASCEMVLRWFNKDSKAKAEDIRNEYIPKNEDKPIHFGMASGEVARVFSNNNIKYKYAFLTMPKYRDTVIDELKLGKIFMLPLKMGKISAAKSGSRSGTEFPGEYNHWVIVKGYKIIEGKTYLEVYDPMSSGGESGKDRYYLLQEVLEACSDGFVINGGK